MIKVGGHWRQIIVGICLVGVRIRPGTGRASRTHGRAHPLQILPTAFSHRHDRLARGPAAVPSLGAGPRGSRAAAA